MVRRPRASLTLLSAAVVVACASPGPASQPPTAIASIPTPTLAATPTSQPTSRPTTELTPEPTRQPTGQPAATAAPALPEGRLMATVEVDLGPCAIAEFGDSVWVTSLNANTVSQIDGASNQVVQTVDVGLGPCAIASDGEALWIGILSERALVRLDPESGEVTDRLEVGGPVWDIQVGHGSVWVSVQQANTLLRIDPETRQIVETFAVGAQPSGLAITPAEVWLATSVSAVMRVDPETNQRLSDITIDGDPTWFASGPRSVVLTLSNTERVVVLDTENASLTNDFELRQHPRDPGFVGDSFWVTANGPNRVIVVSPASGEVIGGFQVPDATAIWTAEGLLGDGWVLDFGGRDVFRYGPESGL